MIKISAEAIFDVAETTKINLNNALKCLQDGDIEACKTIIKVCAAKMETVEEIFDFVIKEGE